ncbi:WD repeat-containing protein jip5, partial [Ascosphaera atra]
DERIYVSKDRDGGESLEVISVVPDGLLSRKTIAIGQTDGNIQLIQLGSNKKLSTLQHDELEGVAGLGFDVNGRMVSGGGNIVKVWCEAEGNEENEDEDSDMDSDSEDEKPKQAAKRNVQSDSDSDSEDDSRNRRKKKGKKGKGRGGGAQVMAFDDLD